MTTSPMPCDTRPYELHGFVVKTIHLARTGTVTLEFADRTRAVLEVRMKGASELVTPFSEVEKIFGERVDDFEVKIERPSGDQGAAGVDRTLTMTITTTEDGPSLALVWALHPETGEDEGEIHLRIVIEPRPEEAIH